MMNKESLPYRALCAEYYDLDKPNAPADALKCYLRYAEEAKGSILEPMCGTGRFLVPLLEKGYSVSGFDYSPHMLNACRSKCVERNLSSNLQEATFETYQSSDLYKLIFIPCGSFCHLISPQQVSQALTFIANKLAPGGKFVFEVETLKAVREPQGVWKGRWINKPDGSKIVLSILSQFDAATRVETGLFRYELWEDNAITQTEVEDYQVRHYTPEEIEKLLDQHGLKVIGKWQTDPFAQIPAREDAPVILYECQKG